MFQSIDGLYESCKPGDEILFRAIDERGEIRLLRMRGQTEKCFSRVGGRRIVYDGDYDCNIFPTRTCIIQARNDLEEINVYE